MWQRAPICAHDPTSACESIIVPAPTYAPTFTYIGGMQTTPGATYAPSRTVEPPGTMRTPSVEARSFRGARVSLSKNGERVAAFGDRQPRRGESRRGCPPSPMRRPAIRRPRSAPRRHATGLASASRSWSRSRVASRGVSVARGKAPKIVHARLSAPPGAGRLMVGAARPGVLELPAQALPSLLVRAGTSGRRITLRTRHHGGERGLYRDWIGLQNAACIEERLQLSRAARARRQSRSVRARRTGRP